MSFALTCHFFARTKSLEGGTCIWECLFDVLFKGVRARFWLRSIENYFEKILPNACSAFQPIRLGGIKLKFATSKPPPYICVRHAASMITLCSPNEDFGRLNIHFRVHFLTTFQGCEYRIWATNSSKMHSEIFVRPSKIFVWGA